jgi:hypothetical protein
VKNFVYDKQKYFVAFGLLVGTITMVYNWNKTFVEPQSGETRLKSKRQILRLKQKANKAKGTVIARPVGPQMVMNQFYLDMVTKVLNNYYYICFSNKKGPAGYIVFIYKTTAIVPHHYFDEINAKVNRNEEFSIIVRQVFDAGEGMSFDPILFLSFFSEFLANSSKKDGDKVVDTICLTLPRDSMHDAKDIVDFFLDTEDKMFQGVTTDLSLIVIDQTKKTDREKHLSGRANIIKNFEYLKNEDGYDYSLVVGIEMPIYTTYGICGAYYFGTNGIVAMHTAGDGKMAYGISLIDEISALQPYRPALIPPIEKRLPPGLEFESFSSVRPQLTPISNGVAVGTTITNPLSNESKKKHSKMFGCMGLTRLAPAAMGIGPMGERPLEIANAKYAGLKYYIDPDLMYDTSSIIRHKKSALYGPLESSLSMEEAILGNKNYPHNFGAIKRIGSIGADKYIPEFHSSMKGKTYILGTEGDIDLNSPKAKEFMLYVENLIQDILDDKKPIAVIVQFIKDELLPKTKVDAYNSRLIFATAFSFLVIGRMQYGPYIRRTTDVDTHIIDGMGVGINPFKDWNTIVFHMTRFGRKRILAYDFKTFDGNQSRQVVIAALEDMASYCPEPKDDDTKVKDWCIENLVSSYHIIAGYLVLLNGCNWSGNYATVYINGHSNERYIIIGLIGYLLAKIGKTILEYEIGDVDLYELARNYDILTYGDDGLVSVGPLFDDITTGDIAKTLKLIGVVFTNADKTDPILNPIGLQDIDDVTFIKRGFKKIRGKYVAPLDLESIQKSLDWTEDDVSEEDFKRNTQIALYELSYHGEEVFNLKAPGIIVSYQKAGFGTPIHTTFEQCFTKANCLEGFTHY